MELIHGAKTTMLSPNKLHARQLAMRPGCDGLIQEKLSTPKPGTFLFGIRGGCSTPGFFERHVT